MMKGLDGRTGAERLQKRAPNLQALRKNGRHQARRCDCGVRNPHCAGGWRRLSQGAQMEFHAAGVSGGASTSCAPSTRADQGTFKDRDIIRYNPHLLIEAWPLPPMRWALSRVASHSADLGPNTMRFEEALEEARIPEFAGRTFWVQFLVRIAYPGKVVAYIAAKKPRCSDLTEGRKGQPRFKPPFRPAFGLYGKQTMHQQHRDVCRRAVDPARRW